MNTSHEIDAEGSVELFDRWLGEAEQAEPNDPNAAALPTAAPEGAPSAHMVLVKPVMTRPQSC